MSTYELDSGDNYSTVSCDVSTTSHSSMLMRKPNAGVFNDFASTRYRLEKAGKRVWKTLSEDLPDILCRQTVNSIILAMLDGNQMAAQRWTSLFANARLDSFRFQSSQSQNAAPVTMFVTDQRFFLSTLFQFDVGFAKSYVSGFVKVQGDEGEENGLTNLFMYMIQQRIVDLQSTDNSDAGTGTTMLQLFNGITGRTLSMFHHLRYLLLLKESKKPGSYAGLHTQFDLSSGPIHGILKKIGTSSSAAIFSEGLAMEMSSNGGSVGMDCPSNDGSNDAVELDDAQRRKLNLLIQRGRIESGQTLLDIGFGLDCFLGHIVQELDCSVVVITKSKQKLRLVSRLAARHRLEGRVGIIAATFKDFASDTSNHNKFDCVLNFDMLSTTRTGYAHEFFGVVESVLRESGMVLVEAVVAPVAVSYKLTLADAFFPRHEAPSLASLIQIARDASSHLRVESVESIGSHYARTLATWRNRFHQMNKANKDGAGSTMGRKAEIGRAWEYYTSYCEAAFKTGLVDYAIIALSIETQREEEEEGKEEQKEQEQDSDEETEARQECEHEFRQIKDGNDDLIGGLGK